MNDDLRIRRHLPYIYNYKTTTKTDYRRPRVTPYAPEAKKPRLECLMPRPPLKDSQTLSVRHPRQSNVPFYLYHRPRGIIDTDPSDIQKPFYKFEDQDREEVQKKRPRVYITPAISMDDVDEPARQLLVNSIYTTNMTEATKNVSFASEYVKAPLSEVYAPANVVNTIIPSIKVPPCRQPYVSPEWRMQSVSWDTKQIRGHVDPTATFWLKMKSSCEECKATTARRAHRKMMTRI